MADEMLNSVPAPAESKGQLAFATKAESLLYESLVDEIGDEAAREALDYGFYEKDNRYWMLRRKDTVDSVSNFVIRAKFLIQGVTPRRIITVTNVYNKRAELALEVEQMISLDKFKAAVEGCGNFLFEGKATDLARIKNKLFNHERVATEIGRLGQQKNGLYAFANGVYDGENFIPVDDTGMVQHQEKWYFIPVLGSTKTEDDEFLRNYRKFAHTDNGITFAEWSDMFCKVYEDNGRIGIAFFLFSLFRDIIFERTKGAPMLFLFGQRGSGKGTMANSLLALFGKPQDPLMLGGASTVVGFMRKLGQFANAMVWLDEYKNDIGEKKIESLKNIWDGIGYERGNKDSSMGTQSTPVTSAAMLSGQEIPNVEPALFSRTVLCEFKTMQHTQEQVDIFNLLRTLEDNGLTNVTLECLTHRDYVREKFHSYYNEIATVLRSSFVEGNVIERQVNNYATLIAIVRVIGEKMKLPFTYTYLLLISEQYMIRQSSMMSSANEVQQFFEMVAFLLGQKLINDGVDIQVNGELLKIRTNNIMPLYREYSRRQGGRALDKGTLINYLSNCSGYDKKESQRSAHRFKNIRSPTSCQVFLHKDIKKYYGVDFLEIIESDDFQEVTENTPENPF